MKRIIILIPGLLLSLGCARVRVEAPKEPIKVDISMRLDIYQHVAKDIDIVESIVSGGKDKTKPADRQSFLGILISSAFAKEELSPVIEEAALRRKERFTELGYWEKKGVIGENRSGLVEIRDEPLADASIEQLVESENTDRMVIYREIARKNDTYLQAVQELYAKKLRDSAAVGTLIEVFNHSTGSYEWKVK